MKKKVFKWLFGLSLTFLLFSLTACLLYVNYFTPPKRMLRLQSNAVITKAAQIPMRFMLLSRGESGISARFYFYNIDNREVAQAERAWVGRELKIESVLVPIQDIWLGFPLKIYTDALPVQKANKLWIYYIDKGLPLIQSYNGQNSKEQRYIKKIFSLLRSGYTDTSSYIRVQIDNIANYEIGAVYSLSISPRGEVEIIRE